MSQLTSKDIYAASKSTRRASKDRDVGERRPGDDVLRILQMQGTTQKASCAVQERDISHRHFAVDTCTGRAHTSQANFSVYKQL